MCIFWLSDTTLVLPLLQYCSRTKSRTKWGRLSGKNTLLTQFFLAGGSCSMRYENPSYRRKQHRRLFLRQPKKIRLITGKLLYFVLCFFYFTQSEVGVSSPGSLQVAMPGKCFGSCCPCSRTPLSTSTSSSTKLPGWYNRVTMKSAKYLWRWKVKS